MEVSKLYGIQVITDDAYTLGEVEGAHADPDQWKITHLEVSLTNEATKELGFKKPFLGDVIVCLPVAIVKGFGDVITLKKSLQEMKDLEECKSND
jgi:sporulation protein YlmC with PRC-barrel domain